MIGKAIIIGGIILAVRYGDQIVDLFQDSCGMAEEHMNGEFGDKFEAWLQKWADKVADNIDKTE